MTDYIVADLSPNAQYNDAPFVVIRVDKPAPHRFVTSVTPGRFETLSAAQNRAAYLRSQHVEAN